MGFKIVQDRGPSRVNVIWIEDYQGYVDHKFVEVEI